MSYIEALNSAMALILVVSPSSKVRNRPSRKVRNSGVRLSGH